MHPLKLILIICILSITFTLAFGFTLSTTSDSNVNNDVPSLKSSLGTLNALGLTSTNSGLNSNNNLGLGTNPTLADLFNNKKHGLGGGNGGTGGTGGFLMLCRSLSIPPTSWTILQHRQCSLACINAPTPNIGGQCSADGVCTCTVLAG